MYILRFFVSIFKGSLNIKNLLYYPLYKCNALKISQFNTFQKILAFYDIFVLLDISLVNDLKTFYIDI